MELDELDQLANKYMDGYLVRKDLVRKFGRQFPVPTYVVEFMLGRYCASVDEQEIEEGLQIVEKQLSSKTVRAGEEELFKARAREQGSVKVIDLISARLDAKKDCYLASLPSLRLSDVRIESDLVKKNERMLTGGFYAEVELAYDGAETQGIGGMPFSIVSLKEVQVSNRSCLETLAEARSNFTTEQWKDFLLRSIGIESETLTEKQKNAYLLRMVPFVERNYNLIELGPRGTGKSHLYQQISPYAHLVSGGKASVAKMFVNNSTGQRGLVCMYDVVCFDEVSGISFDQKDGVNILKGYMESGEFSRGKESIRADGGVVMVGNFDVDVEQQQRVGHLFGPLPPEMRNDTAFMDRIHAYLPGWDIPKLSAHYFTNHFALVSDFLSQSWNLLRNQSRLPLIQGRVSFGSSLSGRDTNAVNKTISGLLKLLYPSGDTISIPDEDIEWAVRIALEARRRVKEQQKRIGSAEFRNTQFSYIMSNDKVEKYVTTPELYKENSITSEPLPPGQVWSMSPGNTDGDPQGLFRIEVACNPGSGMHILNKPAPIPFKESLNYAEQNLYANAMQYVGDKKPREFEFNIQLKALDTSRSGAKLGVPILVALCSAMLAKPVKAGMVIAGEISLGGSIETLYNPVELVESAVEKGAAMMLLPVSSRHQLNDLSDEMAARIDIKYYIDGRDAVNKALEI
ncbi:ATP-dependent Lon protease [Butyrivibrio sp. ob235]|uniref:protease Lon-related BREX system protein BrxL n=1 Tax=Butyrivibrio sp. ob235 TaxID=1761780 RepID=UPI0008AB5020|nr:protease Lon-related BREX system protein BrxL [Butyrivibrio sp. ob235]SEM42745.1 ATP-dependent Lon protease [Butyrivibrio sp. ob235]